MLSAGRVLGNSFACAFHIGRSGGTLSDRRTLVCNFPAPFHSPHTLYAKRREQGRPVQLFLNPDTQVPCCKYPADSSVPPTRGWIGAGWHQQQSGLVCSSCPAPTHRSETQSTPSQSNPSQSGPSQSIPIHPNPSQLHPSSIPIHPNSIPSDSIPSQSHPIPSQSHPHPVQSLPIPSNLSRARGCFPVFRPLRDAWVQSNPAAHVQPPVSIAVAGSTADHCAPCGRRMAPLQRPSAFLSSSTCRRAASPLSAPKQQPVICNPAPLFCCCHPIPSHLVLLLLLLHVPHMQINKYMEQ